MKSNISFLIIVISLLKTFAQKVDFDSYFIPVEFIRLPKHYCDSTNRTISILSNAEQSIGFKILDRLKVYGFEFVEQNSAIDAHVKVFPLKKGSAVPTSRLIEEKDKDGKLIRRYTLHKVQFTSSCNSGSFQVLGPKSETTKEIKKKDSDMGKSKQAENPFLAGVEDTENVIKETAQKPKVLNRNIWPTYAYSTSETNTSSAAGEEFSLNSNQAFSDHKIQYHNLIIETVNFHLNDLYGFPPITERVKFQVTDSDKHPEDKKYKQAIEALKVILAKIKFNNSIDDIAKELNPIIDYFQSLKKKYKSDDKADRKMRHWTSWNLAQIYLCIDDLVQASKEANYIIKEDFDKGDGEKLLEEIADIKEDYKRIHVSSRHFAIDK